MSTPTGWRLVPEEPTEEMLYAMADMDGFGWKRADGDVSDFERWGDYYKTALAAAPQPPTQPEPTLWALTAREALELIAAPMRPDGTWNRDREACRRIAAEALGRYDEQAEMAQAEPSGLTDADIISLAYDVNAMPEQMTDAGLMRFARAIERLVRGKQ